MKNIRKLLLLALCLMVAFLFASCGFDNDKGRTDLGSDTEPSVVQEEPQTPEETAEEPEEKKEEKADDEPKELSDEYVDLEEDEDEDPANADPTLGGDDDQATEDDLQRRYIGTWTLKGLEFRDGSFEDAGKCTIEVMRDGNYTMKGKLSGEEVDRQGRWSINEKKKLVMGKDKLGVNDEGYLLMYSGQRDGKGSKLYYAFQRN